MFFHCCIICSANALYYTVYKKSTTVLETSGPVPPCDNNTAVVHIHCNRNGESTNSDCEHVEQVSWIKFSCRPTGVRRLRRPQLRMYSFVEVKHSMYLCLCEMPSAPLGIEVELTSVHTEKEIVGSRGIHLVANSTISECKDKTYDLIAVRPFFTFEPEYEMPIASRWNAWSGAFTRLC